MIVVLTGAHSNGKSTLVEFFRGKEGFECVDSVTRSTISAEDRKIDEAINLDQAQLNILHNIQVATDELVRKNQENPDKIYLVDRCVFDFIAYTRAFEENGLVSKRCLKVVEDGCFELWKNYDLVCYLGIEFPIVSDGVRSEDEVLRRRVDKEILKQVLWNNVRAINLYGPVLKRVADLQVSIDTIRNSKSSK